MSATEFRASLDDMRFVLFQQLKIQEALAGFEVYEDFDQDVYDATLMEAQKICEEVLHPINIAGDKEKAQFVDGGVVTPKGYKEAWNLCAEGGWIGVSAPQEFGGIGLPNALGLAVNEMFSGSAEAFSIYMGLTGGAARDILAFGTDEQKATYLEKLFTGQWAGTMLLTEAGAGSAVGDNRTKAVPSGRPGVYHLEGEKIFISGGDSDLAENIIHLALARTPGAPAGTKGLSLFIVPKFLVSEDGELGERNDIHVVGIEHKLGINGSATCTLALGANGPCEGYLLGEEFKGMKLMFHMMNEARIGVGAQGVAAADAAYQYARSFAVERIQGPDLDDIANPESRSVEIVRHPDVRRNLMTLKVMSETMRSLLYRLAYLMDVSLHETDEKAKKKAEGRVDLLVPVLKAHCSDKGFEMASLAVQVFGGYGYTTEYPVEQLLRDARISAIYEGTNGIQAMDLLGRKLRIKNGLLFMDWVQDAQKFVKKAKEAGFDEADDVGKAVGHLGATAMYLGQLAMKKQLKLAFLQASPFLTMFGTVLLGIEALEQAVVAKELMETEGETPLLKGKLLNLRFYTRNILPGAVAMGKSIQSGDDSALDASLWPLA
ncbi:MAG: acyl-CoA dehydrogenase [Deltaproteobacteria bacterium]|nr:acyl-CoA dehydrogenase [Deltaproteobacteria bacterium]